MTPFCDCWLLRLLRLLRHATTPTTALIIDYYAKHFLIFYSDAVESARGVQHAGNGRVHAGPLGLIQLHHYKRSEYAG